MFLCAIVFHQGYQTQTAFRAAGNVPPAEFFDRLFCLPPFFGGPGQSGAAAIVTVAKTILAWNL